MPVHFGANDGSDPMVMLSPLNQPSRAAAQRRKLHGTRSLPSLKHPAQQLDFTQLKSGKSPKGAECFSPTSNSSSSAGGMRPRKNVSGDLALDRSAPARRPSRQQVTLPSLQGAGASPQGSRQPEARGQPTRSSSVPGGRGTPLRHSPKSSPKASQAGEERAQQVAEAHALHEISNIAHSITGDLDKIMQRCDELGQDHAGDVSVLQSISDTSRRICEDLNSADPPDQAAAEEQAKPPELAYDDDTLANARKLVEVTNHLCADLDGKSLTLESKVHDTAELSALQEISSVTKKVFDDMCKLQEEEWAMGVLASVPSGDEAKEDKLLTGGAAEQGGKQDAVEESVTPEMPVTKLLSDRPNSAPNGVFTLPKVEGLPDIAELTARGGDDGFTEAYVARVQAAFKRFQVPDSADCHVGDLCDLLQYLGHVIAKKDDILPLIREVTSYDYLDFDEFLLFMERYLPWERQQFHEVFNTFDEDGSGEISILELKEMLKHLGFIPLRGMLREALTLVDDNASGNLDFEELLLFLAVYRRAEGFSQGEVTELRKIFDRFTKHEGGVPRKLLPAEALCDSLVQVFGLHVSEFAEKLEEQMRSGQGLQKSSYAVVESGKSESLTFAEYLIFARKTREAALEKLKGTFDGHCSIGRRSSQMEVERQEEFKKADLDGDGMISRSELRKVLVGMGYTPLTDNVEEVLEEVDTGQDNMLDFHDFFDFILIYRQREGFRRDEVQEMNRLFERFDGDDSGEISAMELKELFRHMGYRVTMDQVHLFVAQVDENNSNCLDFREYLRLMQLHREAELKSCMSVFKDLQDASTGLLAIANIDKAFKGLKQEPPKVLPKFNGAKGVDFDGFVKLVDSCRSDLVARERKKAGFTDERIAELQEVFGRFDKDGSGEIDNIELMGILTEFGWNPKTQQEQQELMRKLQVAKDAAREADPELVAADDGIEFWTFVQLSRMLETEHEHAEEELMNRLMKELNFNQKEVDDFRQIFMNKKHEVAQEVKDSGQKEPDGLPRDDVRRLVRSLNISLIGENKVKLDTELKRLGCDDNKPLDFPGFLQLMRWIMTADMASAVTQAPDGKR